MTAPASTRAPPARTRGLRRRANSLLSVEEVRRLHPNAECRAWQTVVELVDLGVVEARVDRAGFVRLYPVGVLA